MKVGFDDTPFRTSHWTSPKGRGSWAFSTEKNPDPTNPDACWFTPGGMTFTEAKAWARKEVARRFGADARGVVYVQP